MNSYKPFYISLIFEIITFLLLRWTQGLGFSNEALFGNHIIEWIVIAIIWPIIGLIRNTKEKNTNYFKILLIIIEIYLFSIIFIQDGSNFNKREFFILYLSFIGITKEVFYKRQKKRQNNFFISLYGIISSIIILIGVLMRYREPIDMNKIINNQNYSLLTHFDEIEEYYSITLKNNYFTDYIEAVTGTTSHTILKNMDYTLEFLSKNKNENNYIIIQDQLGNIIKIPPQTAFNFSTNQQQIQFTDKKKYIEYYSIYEDFPNELEEYKEIYNNTIKNNILSNLPNMLRNNYKLQKTSIFYTKFLGTVFPFRYGKNLLILNDYIPYFIKKENTKYEQLNNKYSIFKENEKIGQNNIKGRKKYKLF